ncbi:hypothetical protein J6590_068823 [Homalodisca vitripennis]|nr:hypothetical protein J6590_042869 [Homalodisca vitripennis]KAG8259498.1 hypothetical protein J6590_011791 [Homalodisca vitripennis]KAG8314571.1 hypothetical protein J6590_090099 [Homalodisca vitripennis]KAG8325387.1 hypothetical protein J6590_068823 [Homalodisca vitripennis]
MFTCVRLERKIDERDKAREMERGERGRVRREKGRDRGKRVIGGKLGGEGREFRENVTEHSRSLTIIKGIIDQYSIGEGSLRRLGQYLLSGPYPQSFMSAR